MKSDNGLFLAFDGVPRSGRTTYAQHVADLLASDDHGYAVTRVALPSAPSMRASGAEWVAEMVAACDAIARETILPALERGDVVIADGWITSVLLRARVSIEMKTPDIIAAWTRATKTACPDAEYIFRDTFGETVSPITRAVTDWEKIVCARPVARFPAHPLHPRNDRRVFALDLTPPRTKHYLAIAAVSLLNARRAMPDEGEIGFAEVLAESADDRELGLATARMKEWQTPLYGREKMARDPEAIEMAVLWPSWSEATRAAVVAMLPDDAARLRSFRDALASEGASDASLDARIEAAGQPTNEPVASSGPAMIG